MGRKWRQTHIKGVSIQTVCYEVLIMMEMYIKRSFVYNESTCSWVTKCFKFLFSTLNGYFETRNKSVSYWVFGECCAKLQ